MSVIGNMILDAPDQVDSIDSSLSQINEQIDDITEQINALTNDMCGVTQHNLSDYLDGTKVTLITGGATVEYGPDYGLIDYSTGGITDWKILDSTGFIVYSLTVNWDNDPLIEKYIDDFDFANDYLTRPLTSGATYGLIPNRTALLTAKTILTENKTKIEESETALQDYK